VLLRQFSLSKMRDLCNFKHFHARRNSAEMLQKNLPIFMIQSHDFLSLIFPKRAGIYNNFRFSNQEHIAPFFPKSETTRSMMKALLAAMLEPLAELQKWEIDGDYTRRLAMLEELKTMPFGAVWDYYCTLNNVPVGTAWIDEVRKYEANVLSKR
jgi:hypothetical protein